MTVMARGMVVAGLAMAAAAPAGAQLAEGWYLGVEAGASQPLDAGTTGGGRTWSTDYAAGPAAMGTAGYGFGPGKLGRLRVEGELGWRGGSVDGVNGAAGSGDADAASLMANVVTDFLPDQRVHPFVGIGLGGAVVNSSASAAGAGYSGDDTVLAVQALAGVGVDVGRDIGLTLAYRYFATQDPALKTSTGAAADSEFGSHALTAGITFRFRAPPAPSAAVAAPAPVPVPAAAPPAVPTTLPDSRYVVLFDWNSAAVTPAGHLEIEKAAVAAKSGARPRLELSGHSDRSGPEGYNMRLSVGGGSAVRGAPVGVGVDPAAISVVGKGEKDPAVATGDGVREPRNRRVEILLP